MKAEQNLLPVLLTSMCILKVYSNCSQTLLICGKTFIMPGPNPHVKEQSGLQFPGHCLEGELKPTGKCPLWRQRLLEGEFASSKSDYSQEHRSIAGKNLHTLLTKVGFYATWKYPKLASSDCQALEMGLV